MKNIGKSGLWCARAVGGVAVILATSGAMSLQASSISFEDLDDGTQVTTQYSGLGVTFTGAMIFQPGTVWRGGVSLNEAEFPPYSGANVLIDLNGPLMATFSVPVTQMSGRITSTVPVTLTAYDFADNVVGSVSSAFSENYVSSGNPPNELFALSSAGGISRFELVGDLGGTSFTLDDLTFSNGANVPDGGGAGMFAMMCLGGWLAVNGRPVRSFRAAVSRG